jgi:hypothetical protein
MGFGERQADITVIRSSQRRSSPRHSRRLPRMPLSELPQMKALLEMKAAVPAGDKTKRNT